MSSALDRIREQRSISTSDRRYVREEAPSLEEISDPDTLEDESSRSWREWAGENTVLTVLALVFGVFLLGVLLYLVSRYSPAALSTLWTRRGVVAVLAGLGLGFVFGMKSLRTKMVGWDQLTIKTSDNQAKRYYGYFYESDLGDYPLFVPVTGIAWNGDETDPYRIADISRQLVQKRGTPWQEDDPVVMRLDPAWSAVSHTDSGTIVVTVTDGFEPDDQGRESNLKPITPSHGSKKRLKSMRDQLEKARDERDFHEEMADKRQKQLSHLLDVMDKPIDETVEDRIEFYERIEEARNRRGRRRERENTGESETVAPQPNKLPPVDGDDDA